MTCDASGILAVLDRRDSHHASALAELRSDRGPFFVPDGIMAEIAYMVDARLGHDILDAFILDLENGGFSPECSRVDLPRIRVLTGRYRDLPLGFADAAVIACAERHGGRVLSYDVRHFSTVAGERTIQLAGME